MVALAPNTSETSPWDVLNTFPKLHSRAREAFTRTCTEVPHSKSLNCVEIWQAIYDCRDGLESFTRDPIGYEDGNSLYESYLRMVKADPYGNKCCVLLWNAWGSGSGSSGSGSTGHVALKCGSNPSFYQYPNLNPGDYYSFGAGPTENDDRRPPNGRAPYKVECFTCQLDETKIRNAWAASSCDRRFNLVGTELSAAGLPVQYGIYMPGQVWRLF